ncbi:MAG: hypothetical protein J6C55_01900 [Oscillospiraceae bacterium]|nr:hypothetical protein [Oscillospiraceae bacterium]
MINIKQNIIKILKPLSIYKLKPGSKTDNEISVFSSALQKLNNKIDKLLKESFTQTAEDFGLSSKINLLDLKINISDSVSQIRNKILKSLSTNSNNFNKQDIINSLKSFGFDCNLEENFKDESVTISFKDKNFQPNDISFFKEIVFKLLPAHLEIVFDINQKTTWEDLDNLEIDPSQEFSWDNF